jgi:uncharacterized membrane protein YphA (DoxX/SURF4 family)
MHLSEPARRRILLFELWLLGIIFTAAACLKAIDIDSFERQITRYNLASPKLAAQIAISIVLIEAVLGLCCIVGFQVKRALWGIVTLLSLFVVATALRWNVLQGTDCSCFGTTIGGGPGSVIWHNALLLFLTANLIFFLRKGAIQYSFRWVWVTIAAAVVFTALFFGQPHSVNGLLSRDAVAEDHIRVFLSATCKTCQKSVGKVLEITRCSDLPPVRVFIGAQSESQISDLLKDERKDVNYIPVTFSQLAREAQQVPTIQVLRDGKVVKEWVGEVPSLGEVKQAVVDISILEPERKLTKSMPTQPGT